MLFNQYFKCYNDCISCLYTAHKWHQPPTATRIQSRFVFSRQSLGAGAAQNLKNRLGHDSLVSSRVRPRFSPLVYESAARLKTKRLYVLHPGFFFFFFFCVIRGRCHRVETKAEWTAGRLWLQSILPSTCWSAGSWAGAPRSPYGPPPLPRHSEPFQVQGSNTWPGTKETSQ